MNIWKTIYHKLRRKIWRHRWSSELYTQLKQLWNYSLRKYYQSTAPVSQTSCESRSSLNFFQALISQLFKLCQEPINPGCVYNCDDQLCLQNILAMFIILKHQAWKQTKILKTVNYVILHLSSPNDEVGSTSIQSPNERRGSCSQCHAIEVVYSSVDPLCSSREGNTEYTVKLFRFLTVKYFKYRDGI